MCRAFWFVCFFLLAHMLVAAEPAIDGSSATRWKAATDWVINRPEKFGVTNDHGTLVFTAEGAGTEIPWLLDLKDFPFSGNERYLLVRYRATGMSTNPGVYFLHGQEGSHGGRTYARADALIVDGKWHTLAVDLLAIEPLESTHLLALKVFVSGGRHAKLLVESIRFTNELPAGAVAATPPLGSPFRGVVVDWSKLKREAGRPAGLTPMTGWLPTPATEFSTRQDDSSITFTVRGAGKGMRWRLVLPEPIDLSQLRHLGVRYKASGKISPTTYAIWLGGKTVAKVQPACSPLSAADLQADEKWHNVSVSPSGTFVATELAIGLDCAGDEAQLTLDSLQFSSRPRRWKIREILNFQPQPRPRGSTQDGFIVQPASVAGAAPSLFLPQRLNVSDWFTAEDIVIGGIPFNVNRDPGGVPQTPLSGFGTLSVILPAGVSEIYLLTATTAQPTELWGIDWKAPRPQEVLDVPEKVVYEIRYESGPSDFVLPINVQTGRWGMQRGLGVNVVHPDPQRRATTLLLHDRMQTASFAILGATLRTDRPRIAEPNWNILHEGTAPTKTAAVIRQNRNTQFQKSTVHAGGLVARFQTEKGLTWSRLGLADESGRLECRSGPVFLVKLGDKSLHPEEWKCEKPTSSKGGWNWLLRHRGSGLKAVINCQPAGGNQLLLKMTLTNETKVAKSATLMFPVIDGIRFGSAKETWYLCGKRGGIINNEQASFREPMGERHPLQMDGFFNPHSGLALACLTHDTSAQHHFINLTKNELGGAWSVEYVERDLAPGASFTTTETALVLRFGDWRAIFAAYQEWLHSWFKPAAPRKQWFEKSFAMASGSGYYEGTTDPKQRGAIQPQVDRMLKSIGVCDFVHLFGWGASKKYGDWGDYDHYEEIGGQAYFRQNIQAVQQQGIAVSLYLDAYLSCEQGHSVGKFAKAWSMKRSEGSPHFIDEFKAYNQCPTQKGWQEHLVKTYRRVRDDFGPRILYIDEYGATDGRWSCHARDHGHNSHEIPYAGEVGMLQKIRDAVGPEMALFTEYPPAEVSRRYLDGSITYQALWSADQEPLSPHFIDLQRFAFPDFKQFHIIHYVSNQAGNWWLYKFPFFNGEVYCIGLPNLLTMDEPSLAFVRKAVQIQCAHRDSFASHEVYPLIRTEVSGVFANEFRGLGETVWTLYNANGRSVNTPVLRVQHQPGARYEDAWNGKQLNPAIQDGFAIIRLDLPPKGIGCLVRRLK